MLQKSYLEYAEHKRFGVLTSFPSDVLFDSTGKLAITGALDEVAIYNIRLGTKISTLSEKSTASGARHRPAQVARLSLYRGPGEFNGALLAAGYTDGVIRVWNINKKELVSRFDGHKSEVTALAFNAQGTQLVSGSKDTDVIIWDLYGDKGLVKFRGHKNLVTDVAFVESRGPAMILSASKDRLIKVWDLKEQHCVQTVVGHASVVWAMAVNPSETRVIAASSDNEIRVYKILSIEELEEIAKLGKASEGETADENANTFNELESERRLEFIGTIQRKVNDRPYRVKFTGDGTIFAVQNAAKTIELFTIHTEEEIKKKMKRRRKREKERLQKKQAEGETAEDPSAEVSLKQTASDEFSSKQIIRTDSKILNFDFEPSGRGKEFVVSFYNNSIELYHRKKQTAAVVSSIHLGGHRTDIRWAALSSHDEMLMSTSKDELKIWNVSTCNPIRTIASGYGLCGIFAPGDRHVVIGTKTGAVEVYDLHAATLLESNTEVHSQSVFGLEMKPDKTGFVTVSADKKVAFWDFALIDNEEGTAKRLSIDCVKVVEMSESMFCARFSRDGKYLAVSLLDYTVKIYFADSMKFFLSLYGHKLPVMTMDVSSDSSLIVTGSADKNVKIWGLDFGDCHKSLYAHEDSVMRVAFILETHMFMTAGKDGSIKYWDADKFENIMTLEGHQSEVWALAMSSDGMFFVTGGHDRSLRIWNQTDNTVYVDDQRETEMEETWEKTLEAEDATDRMNVDEGEGGDKAEAAPVVRKSLESIKDAEKIIEALDLVVEQQQVIDGYKIAVAEAEKSLTPQQLAQYKKEKKDVIPYPELSPLLLGKNPSDYLLYVITRIRSSNLESALVVLTFTQVLTLLKYLEEWIRKNRELMLTSRVLFSVIKMHQVQLSANRSLKTTIESLREYTHKHLEAYHETISYNLAAMDHIRRLIDDNDASDFFEVSEKLAKIRKEDVKKNKPKRKNYWESSDEEREGMDVDKGEDGGDVLAFAEDSDDF